VTDFDLCFYLHQANNSRMVKFLGTEVLSRHGRAKKAMEGHRRQAMQSKRWSTGLFVFSEVFFLAASLSLAMSLG
jgi:hypothetical protein